MNIVILTMSLNIGGAERVITNLCNQCLINENNVTIITCMKAKSQYMLDKRIQHICIDNKLEEKNQNKIVRFIRRRKVLAKILRAMSIDILLGILSEPSFLILSLRRVFHFPMVVSVRSDPNMEYAFLPYWIMMRILYPKADGVILQTEEAREYFPKKIKKKSVVIPNPINADVIRKSFSGSRKKEIVAVGRLTEEKNYPMMLRSYKRINQQFPEYKLVIYGEGPLRNQLEADIERLKLKNKVVLAGQRSDIYNCIYKSSLFIMTSSHEGMPNALMEAMALELPVIATDCPCGGPRFLINNNVDGILIAPDDDNALVEAAVQLLSNKQYADQLGKEAGRIKNRLAPEKIHQQWEEYLLYIAGGKNVGSKKFISKTSQ